MQYLDPKNDLTFKLIFGDHPHLLLSFLNSILSFPSPIQTLNYLPTELAPETKGERSSIVDVRCTDETGRQFIIEMQMVWTEAFMQRVLHNSAKAYSKQLQTGGKYKDLMPVYSVCILNEVFVIELEEYQHQYKLTHTVYSHKVMEGLEFIFIELPKFKAQNVTEKKLSVLWLRFLSDIKSNQENIPQELLDVPEIYEATQLLNKSAYSPAQLAAYDKYWERVSVERTLEDAGHEKGLEEGIEIGKEIGEEKGHIEEKFKVAKLGIEMGLSNEAIVKLTGLSEKEIIELRRRSKK